MIGRGLGSRGLPVAMVALLTGALAFVGLGQVGATPKPAAARNDWALLDGFTLDVDTSGYELPTSISFVKNPGPDPDDPVYFVTELAGTVKVVTRDRTIRNFAELPIQPPSIRYPRFEGETGLAGMCLDDERGYVFVTYAATDRDGTLHNHMIRFSTDSPEFALEPTATTDFSDVFAAYPTSVSHQIGGCSAADGYVYVGIGDANEPDRARVIDDLIGKLVRLTVDGTAPPDNPFVGDPAFGPGAAYVWAYGFRNPFGVRTRDGGVFVAENGGAVDTFLQIEKGGDYHWDGTDASITLNTDAVISPSVGPVQLDYNAPGSGTFPEEFDGSFFFAASTKTPNRGAGVFEVPFDAATGRVSAAPRSFIEFRGGLGGEVAAAAMGPDGLYFAPLLAKVGDGIPVLKVSYDSDADYPHVIGQESTGAALYQQFGCTSCHVKDGSGNRIGPALDAESLVQRLQGRLTSAAYRQEVDALNEKGEGSDRDRAGRDEVLAAEADGQDPTERVQVWVRERMLNPKFDNPDARMPDLDLTEQQAEEIKNYLLTFGDIAPDVANPPDSGKSLFERAKDGVTTTRFLAGVAAGATAVLVLAVAVALVGRRRRKRGGVAAAADSS